MPEMRLRSATLDDIPVITAIYRPAVILGTASFELEAPTEDEMRRRFEAITGSGYPYLVAEIGAVVAGYGYAGAFRPRPAYRFTVENSIYVAPDHQGKGVGKALLARLIEVCTGQGFRQMIAIIGDSGQRASIGLHRSLGFTFSGTAHSVGYKHGRWLDTVMMQRTLGDGDRTPPPDPRDRTK